MKIRNSFQQENDSQRKLYESRCRQIINEKNQLDKARKELLEQKQSLEDENKHLQTILQSIQSLKRQLSVSHMT